MMSESFGPSAGPAGFEEFDKGSACGDIEDYYAYQLFSCVIGARAVLNQHSVTRQRPTLSRAR
jgi:hypothetical protein